MTSIWTIRFLKLIRTVIRIFVWLIFSILLLFILYSIVVVVQARIQTRDVISTYLQPGKNGISVEDLTEWQKVILLSVEDPSFYSHNGVDLSTPGAGITTISQALVKRFYFKRFKPGFAKLRQSLIAMFAFDALVSKDDQLTLFLNHCYLGNENGRPVIGLKSAAESYFGKSFSQLSENEFIALVAMIIAPNTFHVIDYPERNSERVKRIKNMLLGEYEPKGLFDLYYGKIPVDIQKELPPMSYFEKYYSE